MHKQDTGDSDSDADAGFADLQSVRDLRQHLCIAAQTEQVPVENTVDSCDTEHGDTGLVALEEERHINSPEVELDSKIDMQCPACGVSLQSEERRVGRARRVVTVVECDTCHYVANVKTRSLKRLWCSFQLNMNLPSFALVPKLLGRGGCNVKSIYEETGAKVRVRGRGSGHGEFLTGKEANIPLMVAVSSEGNDAVGFERALELTLELLRGVEQRYVQHCEMNNHQDNQKPFSIGPPLNERLLRDYRTLTSRQLSKKLTREIVARCQAADARSEKYVLDKSNLEQSEEVTVDGDTYEYSRNEELEAPTASLGLLHSSTSESSTARRRPARKRQDRKRGSEYHVVAEPHYSHVGPLKVDRGLYEDRERGGSEYQAVAEPHYAQVGPLKIDRGLSENNHHSEFGSTAACLGLIQGVSATHPTSNSRLKTNSNYYEEFGSVGMSHPAYHYPYSHLSGYSTPSAR